MQKTSENPIVAIFITLIALTAMLILALNLLVKPDRSTDLNPVVKPTTQVAATTEAK